MTRENLPPPARLVLLDTNVQQSASLLVPREIVFQYEPQDFTEDVGSAYASSVGMNRASPIVQYSNGEPHTFGFEARLYAGDSSQSIEPLLGQLKAACGRDDDLSRPPRWQFIWGSIVNETVVVVSLGGIKYDRMRSDGTVYGCTLMIKMQVADDVDLALVAEDRPTDTFYAVTRAGEQWENIAARQYGDALMGELLRQRNPQLPFPGTNPGKVVMLPKPENLRNDVIEAASPPLQRTAEGLALRARVVEARSAPRRSSVLRS